MSTDEEKTFKLSANKRRAAREEGNLSTTAKTLTAYCRD